MNDSFVQTNESSAMPYSQGDSTQDSICKASFASLLKRAESYPDPTPEELAEADRILAEALAPYERKSIEWRERERRKNEVLEYLSPYLVDLSKPVPEPRPIIEHRGKLIASFGNLSAVVGAAKSKKTFLCTALVGGLLTVEGDFGITPRLVRVLWVDTEQSQAHAHKVVKRIHRIAGWSEERSNPMLNLLTLREIEPRERMEVLYNSIDGLMPQLVVVDGISDLMYNTNDIEESDRIVGQLMALSSQYNCHILCVLHTNPNSDKARGHVGSTLQRKAETVLFVHKVGDCSVVEPQFCRNEEFEPFAFMIDEEGLPVECDLPREQESEGDCEAILRNNYPQGIERRVLINKMVEELSISRNAAQARIGRAIKSGRVICANGVVSVS